MLAEVQDEVTIALPFLEDGVRYKTKRLCGPAAWSKWFTLEHRVAGMCLKFLVQQELVPLYRHWTPSGKGSAQYRTTPTPRFLPLKTTKITPIKPAGYVLQLMRDKRTPWL
jgi:hypothetical protein